MCDDMQKEYTHEIVKINGKKGLNTGKRVNITKGGTLGASNKSK